MDDDKALQMGKSSTAGSFYLLIGIAGQSIILALGTLLLNSILSANDLGLYQLVLYPSIIFAFFKDLGVTSAMTQRIAKLRTANKHDEIHDVIFSGVVFEILSGALLTLICFAIANPLAVYYSRPYLAPLIALTSLSIFTGSLVSAAFAIFVGFEKMKFYSFTQILQAVIKTLCGPLLVFLGYGLLGATLGYILSFVIGGLAGIVLVYFALFRPLRKLKIGKCNIKQTLLPMLKYGLPLTPSGVTTIVLPPLFAMFMAWYASDSMIGNYSNAVYFSVLVTFISFPVLNVLFPTFSKLNPEKDPELIKTVFSSSIKYTSILLIPTTMLIMTLSTPLVGTLFPQDGLVQSLFTDGILGVLRTLFTVGAELKFPYSPLFLVVSSVVNLFVLLGSVSLTAFQTGIGKTRQIMKQSLLSIALSVPFAYVIITYFGLFGGEVSEVLVVIGSILAIMVSTLPGMVWGLIWAWKNYHVKADFKNSAKIFTSSLIAAIAAYAFSIVVTAPYVILLAVGAIIYLLIYLTLAPLIGAVNRTDIDNLKAMSSGLGPISKILTIPLMFMRKLCKKS